ncbi:hypothetical protein GW17_00016018, partial [Ensete ventricosum]
LTCCGCCVASQSIQKGGPNPNSNTVLAAILDKARELEVPKEIVERNIKKASEKGQEAYIEKFYEVNDPFEYVFENQFAILTNTIILNQVYGFGGVGMVVEVLTDKVTRSVAAVRGVVKDCGAKLADPGSILFKFRRVRVVNIKANAADKDQLLSIALDAGAEDVIEPAEDEDDLEEDRPDRYFAKQRMPLKIICILNSFCRYYKIVTSSENYSTILSKLRDDGVAFEQDNGFELLPHNPIEVCFIVWHFLCQVDDEAMELNKDLMSKLLELDDVDAVYLDQK